LVHKHRDILAYLFFGGLTTLVNFLVYVPVYHWAELSAAVSNAVAWAAAVVFAFLTNKPFVFKSSDWSAKTVLPEFGKFLGCRLGSGVLETLLLALTVDWLGWNSVLMKVIASVLVVVLNYVGSKLFVFNRNENGSSES